MHLSPSLLLLPTTPSFASSPVLLPHGEISHSTRPGRRRRRSPPADKAVAAEGAASPPPLHMFAEIGSSAYQRGTFTFSPYPPSLPPSLVTPPSHLALSRGSSLNYLNYILILLLLGSPNVSHPAISATFSLLSNGGDTLPPPGAAARALPALCADIGKDIRVEIVAACAAGCSARLGKEVRVT